MPEAQTKKAKTNQELPPIPTKRYFTIGEVSGLCAVKPHVLRYWEQEFPQLKPSKRRGNRRYYQQQDVRMIRTIRELLYEQGFTIGGARQKLNALKATAKPQATTTIASDTKLVKDLCEELEDLLAVLED
ncbi:MAG TPA: MerR family transcriptional regulator [Gammaproteobacteria bacterium]|nr:MerR family transcriptional regulator [Gammaproteobacteria bacterium]